MSKAFKHPDTIDRLEKWNGNLLNWYDTQSLKPLHPRYASSVDSGNFICCLVALRQGLYEYAHEDEQVNQIAERITRIIDNTDLSVFYNRQRNFFHIGYDLESGEMSNSYYDMLMSESRMTSYYAVSSRIVQKALGSFGQNFAKAGRYTGLISWTGTMFEYYMPHLFLPVYGGTLVSEALRFCLWCQKERTENWASPTEFQTASTPLTRSSITSTRPTAFKSWVLKECSTPTCNLPLFHLPDSAL